MTAKHNGEKKFRAYGRHDLEHLPQLHSLSPDERLNMRAVAEVLPFRVNNYVIEELIHWDNIPNDPIYQLTFPQPGMLAPEALAKIRDMLMAGVSSKEISAAAHAIQMGLNPHPAGQRLNVPLHHGKPLNGIQHKYRETVLFFPSQGQTCHAYCTYCFRWPQFVGIDELKFASREAEELVAYLKEHPEATSVLITGGDPLVMKTAVLRRYLEPLLSLEHLISIRIGSKATAYWPYRFLTDPDADDLLRFFEEVQDAGKTLALMAHYSHTRELETDAAQAALRRIRSTGAVVRCQAPMIRHVNDDATVWADMWTLQVRLGIVPYYMFVERDTGARGYFEVPLARALDIFQNAYRSVSGLARTVRGPSMSATPGKVLLVGRARIANEDVFVLRFLQGRDPEWVGQPFFAAFDPKATWLSQLRPAFGEKEFFFAPGMRAFLQDPKPFPSWGESALKHRITPHLPLSLEAL